MKDDTKELDPTLTQIRALDMLIDIRDLARRYPHVMSENMRGELKNWIYELRETNSLMLYSNLRDCIGDLFERAGRDI
jgi:hypothetical protein